LLDFKYRLKKLKAELEECEEHILENFHQNEQCDLVDSFSREIIPCVSEFAALLASGILWRVDLVTESTAGTDIDGELVL
jgi:hypothetical protein